MNARFAKSHTSQINLTSVKCVTILVYAVHVTILVNVISAQSDIDYKTELAFNAIWYKTA